MLANCDVVRDRKKRLKSLPAGGYFALNLDRKIPIKVSFPWHPEAELLHVLCGATKFNLYSCDQTFASIRTKVLKEEESVAMFGDTEQEVEFCVGTCQHVMFYIVIQTVLYLPVQSSLFV